MRHDLRPRSRHHATRGRSVAHRPARRLGASVIGVIAVALALSACGGSGVDGNGGADAASGSGNPGTGSGWVTDVAEPAEAAAPEDTLEAPSGESRMTTTFVGDTEVVTYRPYLDDGSLAPDFDEHETNDSPVVCRPWRDDFYACHQADYGNVGVDFFCSTDGSSAWCPTGMSETIFSRADNIRVLEEPETTMQVTAPAPVRLTLEGMSDYVFAPDPEMERTDATVQYRTQGPVPLWAPAGRSAVDTSNGTWTVYRAPRSSQAPFESVPVTRAVVLTR